MNAHLLSGGKGRWTVSGYAALVEEDPEDAVAAALGAVGTV
jgi:hypothetical protein